MPTVYKVNYGSQSLSVLVDLINDFKNENPFASVKVVVDSKPKALYLRHSLLRTFEVNGSDKQRGLLNITFEDFESFYSQVLSTGNKVASSLLVDAVIWNCLNSDPGSYFYGFREHLPTRNKLAGILAELDSSSKFYEFLNQNFTNSTERTFDKKTASLISLYRGVVSQLLQLGYTLTKFASLNSQSLNPEAFEEVTLFPPAIFYLPELLGQNSMTRLIDLLTKIPTHIRPNFKFIVGSSPVSEVEEYIHCKTLKPICSIYDDENSDKEDLILSDLYKGGSLKSDLPDFKFIITSDIATEVTALNYEICSDLMSGYTPYDLAVMAQDELYGRTILQALARSQIACNGYIRTKMSDSYTGMVLDRFAVYIESGYKGFELWELLSVLGNGVFDKIFGSTTEESLNIRSALNSNTNINPESVYATYENLEKFKTEVAEIDTVESWSQAIEWLKRFRDRFFGQYIDDSKQFSTPQQLNALHSLNNFLKDLEQLDSRIFEASKLHVLQVLRNFLSQNWSAIPVTGNGVQINYLSGSAGVSASMFYVTNFVEGNVPSINSDDIMLPPLLSELIVEDSRTKTLNQYLLMESAVRSCKTVKFFCSLNKLTSRKSSVISRFMLSYMGEMQGVQEKSDVNYSILTSEIYRLEEKPYVNKYKSYYNFLIRNLDKWLNEGDALKSSYAKNPGMNTESPEIEFFKHASFRVDPYALTSDTSVLFENNYKLKKLNMTERLDKPNLNNSFVLTFYKLKDYLYCPKKYFYSNVLKLKQPTVGVSPLSPLDKGNALAKAMQYFNKKLANNLNNVDDWLTGSDKANRLLRKTIEEYIGVFKLPELDEYEKAVLEDQTEALMKFLGYQLVELKQCLDDGLHAIESEKDIEINFELGDKSFKVNGRIDRYDLLKPHFAIIRDYKSTTKVTSVNNRFATPAKRLSLVTYFENPDILQNLFYGWLLYRTQPVDPSKVRFSYEFPFLTPINSVNGDLNESIMQDVTNLVSTTIEGILANEFPALPLSKLGNESGNDKKCEFCSFANICKDKSNPSWKVKYLDSKIGQLNHNSVTEFRNG